MGKRKKLMMFILLTAVIFITAFPVYAEHPEDNTYKNEAEQFGDEFLKENEAEALLEELPDDTKEVLSSLGIDNLSYDAVINIDAKTAFSSVISFFSGEMVSPIKYSIIVFGIISLISILTAAEGGNLSKSESLFSLAECLAVGTVILVPLSECISSACSVIKLSNNFMISLIPILTALVAVSGNPAAALSCNTMIFALAQIISSVAQNVVSPFIRMLFSLNIVSSIAPEFGLNSMCNMIKKTATVMLGFAATVFSGLLTVKGVLAGAADTAVLRSAKFVSGSFIPVVGGAVSDALTSLAGSVSIAKNTVGAFGIIAVAVITLPSIIKISSWLICLNVLSSSAEILGRKSASQFLSGIASGASLLNTIIILNAVVLIISTGVMILIRSDL